MACPQKLLRRRVINRKYKNNKKYEIRRIAGLSVINGNWRKGLE
jgi:hypothetical protein